MSAAYDRAYDRAQEEITRRTALGEFGQPPNLALVRRAMMEMMEIFEQEEQEELSRLSRLSHVIRCGNRFFGVNPAHALHEHPITKISSRTSKAREETVCPGGSLRA